MQEWKQKAAELYQQAASRELSKADLDFLIEKDFEIVTAKAMQGLVLDGGMKAVWNAKEKQFVLVSMTIK